MSGGGWVGQSVISVRGFVLSFFMLRFHPIYGLQGVLASLLSASPEMRRRGA